MKFEDDYLWDGSGEPDPDVQRLEGLLAGYRHAGRAPEAELPKAEPVGRRRRFHSPALLAAAAAVVMAVAIGITWQRGFDAPGPERTSLDPRLGGGDDMAPPAIGQPAVVTEAPPAVDPRPVSPSVVPVKTETPRPRPNRGRMPEPTAVELQPMDIPFLAQSDPFVDAETAKHLERATVLLRSFENARAAEGQDIVDVSYERARSRALLEANRALRQQAEAKGNLPMEDALGGLEPFLIEISNLDAAAKKEDVASIQGRLQRREIASDLQLYAINGPTAGM